MTLRLEFDDGAVYVLLLVERTDLMSFTRNGKVYLNTIPLNLGLPITPSTRCPTLGKLQEEE